MESRAAWFERWGAGFVHTKKDDGKGTLNDAVTPDTHAMIVAWVQQSLQTSSNDHRATIPQPENISIRAKS